MARPPKEDRASVAGLTLTIRVTAADRAALDALVDHQQRALEAQGIAATVTAADVVRTLVRREARAMLEPDPLERGDAPVENHPTPPELGATASAREGSARGAPPPAKPPSPKASTPAKTLSPAPPEAATTTPTRAKASTTTSAPMKARAKATPKTPASARTLPLPLEAPTAAVVRVALARHMKRPGATTKALAAATGIKPAQIARFAAGEIELSDDCRTALARAVKSAALVT